MTTQKQEELKNQLANKAQGQSQQQKPLTPSQQVSGYLKKMMPTMKEVLPKHVDAERLTRIALNVIRTNPMLLECNINSLMGSVMEAAKLGLEPGLLGQCYLIPFKNRKAGTVDCQFVIGYKGMIDLVRRSGQVSTITAREVHEKDEFIFEYGIEDNLIHKPTLNDRGEIIAYYAVAKMKDGGHNFLVMSKKDVEKHRDKYAKAKDFGPWKDEFDSMALKTVLRQLIKYLPISVEYLKNDEQNGVAIHNDFAPDDQIIDLNFETGEIISEQ